MTVLTLLVVFVTILGCLMPSHGFMSILPSYNDNNQRNKRSHHHRLYEQTEVSRRHVLLTTMVGGLLGTSLSPTVAWSLEPTKKKKCTNIESCRAIGEQKVEQDLVENPVLKLECGARYKIIQRGTGESVVRGNGSNVDMIYSISMLSTGYMYSKGFGNEKVMDMNGKLEIGRASCRERVC